MKVVTNLGKVYKLYRRFGCGVQMQPQSVTLGAGKVDDKSR